MRSPRFARAVFLLPLLSSFVLISACSSNTPAFVERSAPRPLSRGSAIFLMPGPQRERIIQSLNKAGLRVSDKRSEYSLTVELGNTRVTRECGTVNNVRYSIASNAERDLVVIKGRGASGSCAPNIFDDMSQTLASLFTVE